ncbi:MAG: DUF4402 domain-containing protein [Bacteroidales bacterium]|nr:DUF4402 domain-containing protein [Paludibacter sp.]MDD3299694.1 DUF4402 domain-containing protein [Bacteroidales bacterium]
MVTSKKIAYGIITLLLAFNCTVLPGQDSGSFTSDITARIVDKPSGPTLSISKSNDVEFGSIIPSATLGSVTINPATGVVSHLNVTLLASSAIRRSATFIINGTPNHSVSIVFSTSFIELSATGVSEKLKYTLNKNNLNAIGGDGTATLKVGGTLEVKGNQPPGNYNGTFSVTVNYN